MSDKFCVAVILVFKERYNNVNKRITIFTFADYLSSYYESQALHLYAITAFKISSYYLMKVCYGLSCLFSYVSAKLRNALPDFIRTYEFTVLKENSGPHFAQRLFFLMYISFNIMYLVGICICYVF